MEASELNPGLSYSFVNEHYSPTRYDKKLFDAFLD
jgi:hypothetical protein